VAVARARGYRSIVGVPLLRDGRAVGSLAVTRQAAGLFADGEIALLQTFADQAVIAIENVRLFTELQQKNEALTRAHAQATEALRQQTATGEILRVISQSPTDVQPVFDAIVESATRLCGGAFGTLATFDGELLHLVATYNWTPKAHAIADPTSPAQPSRALLSGRAILQRTEIHVPDVELDPEYEH